MIRRSKERDDARNEIVESQQSARNLFNEQKRLEKSEDRLRDEVSRSNKAMDKMREEAVRLRSKVNELQHEKSDLKKQHESHLAEEEEQACHIPFGSSLADHTDNGRAACTRSDY